MGCGEGYVGRQILKRGAQHVDGIDISDNMIANAKQIQENENIQNEFNWLITTNNAAEKKIEEDDIISNLIKKYKLD